VNRQFPERLYSLWPTIYRQTDIDEGEPLRAFMDLIESEFRILEADMGALYDNWFIETCDEWVVPYIGDLLAVSGLTLGTGFNSNQRSRVANTIAYRRRKGIAAILEHVAQDVTGWRAHAVEFFELLAVTQYLDHVRPHKGRTVDVRDQRSIEESGTPFDTLAHTLDVRRATVSTQTQEALEAASLQGKYNISNVGLYLWRLQSYPVTWGTPGKLGSSRYSFSPFGLEQMPESEQLFPLFNQPLTETSYTQSSSERSVPAPLSRHPLQAELAALRRQEKPPTNYFTEEPVLQVFIFKYDASPPQFVEIAPQQMMVCDLSRWQGLVLFSIPKEFVQSLDKGGPLAEEINLIFVEQGIPLSANATVTVGQSGRQWIVTETLEGKGSQATQQSYVLYVEGDRIAVYDQSIEVAIDPVLGRLAFPSFMGEVEARVNYSYGFSANIGGGPYYRLLIPATPDPQTWLAIVNSDRPPLSPPESHRHFDNLPDALQAWMQSGKSGHIRIENNGIYSLGEESPIHPLTDTFNITIPEGLQLIIEASDGVAPYITGDLCFIGKGDGSRVMLNGLWMDGHLELQGSLQFELSHCTLRPRPFSIIDGAAATPTRQQPLELEIPLTRSGLQISIKHSIIGGIRTSPSNSSLTIHDSIIDGGTGLAISGHITLGDTRDAQSPPEQSPEFGPPTSLERCTIFGQVMVSELLSASDVIFNDEVRVQNAQTGGIRYSYVPPDSQTPPRYRCQPDLLKGKQKAAASPTEISRIRPTFTSVLYGHPAYAQLGLQCPVEIQTGASNGSEMGVFQHLHQPQRRAELYLALEDYLPFGLEAGVFYVN
jgi:hypothetical protein